MLTACDMQSPEEELGCLGKKEKGKVLYTMKWQSTDTWRWKVLLLAKGIFLVLAKWNFLGGLKMGDVQWELAWRRLWKVCVPASSPKAITCDYRNGGKESVKTWQEGGVPFNMRTPKWSSLSVCLHVNQISMPSNCQNRSDTHSRWGLKATYLTLNRHLYFAAKLVGVEEMERQMTD